MHACLKKGFPFYWISHRSEYIHVKQTKNVSSIQLNSIKVENMAVVSSMLQSFGFSLHVAEHRLCFGQMFQNSLFCRAELCKNNAVPCIMLCLVMPRPIKLSPSHAYSDFSLNFTSEFISVLVCFKAWKND